MGKRLITPLLILLLAVLPAGFAFAQTPTPTRTPTITPTVTPTPSPTPDIRGLTTVGTVIMWAGLDTDLLADGWLPCDGRAVSRSTYYTLYSIVFTLWGGGDGSTTFNLPDLRGRAPVGAGHGTGLTNRIIGQTFGEETHILTVTEMPPHTHEEQFNPGGILWGTGAAAARIVIQTITAASNNAHAVTTSTGGGAAFNQMQPSAVVGYYIYAGKPLSITGGATLEAPTPDGATVYSTVVYGGGSQNVAIHYEVTPGDMVISTLLFVLVGLILIQMYLMTRRLRK